MADNDQRARIVEAAADLLDRQGVAAVTTRGVADAAGVQAPAIYRLLGDKAGLLDAVAEHVLAAHVAAKADRARDAPEPADPVADLAAGWHDQVEFGLAHPAVFRLLADPARRVPSPAGAEGRRLLEAKVHRVAAAGRLRVGERRAADLLQAAGLGAVQVLAGDPDPDPGLAGSMLEAVLARVLRDAPAPVETGARGTAVALRAQVSDLDVLSDAERALLGDWLDRVVGA